MGKDRSRRSDSAYVIDSDGSISNAALHEQMTEGVDDRDLRAQDRAKLHAAGVPAAALNSVFPDLDPLPEE
jgi:hypothetical protein